MPRYAIYYAPEPSSPLWSFGCSVVGYNAATGTDLAQTDIAARATVSPESWRELTGEPRRYGFHATLKAPFEPATGVTEQHVCDAVSGLASRLAPVLLDGLRVAALGRFLALVPTGATAALSALAARCVEDLDHLRAALAMADRERRLRSALSPRQLAYLDRYGYPFVLDEFRFHMTLTGPVDDAAERSRLAAALAAAYQAVVPPAAVSVDRLALFCQPARDARFHIVAAWPLTGLPEHAAQP